MWLLAGLLVPRRLIRLNCCLPLATSDSALSTGNGHLSLLWGKQGSRSLLSGQPLSSFFPAQMSDLWLWKTAEESFRRWSASRWQQECLDASKLFQDQILRQNRPWLNLVSNVFRNAAKILQQFHLRRDLPFWRVWISEVWPQPFCFRDLWYPLITRTLPREADRSFLDQIFFFTALFLQPLPGDFLFVKVTSPLFVSFPWAAPSASTNSCANTTASCSTISCVRAFGKHVEQR